MNVRIEKLIFPGRSMGRYQGKVVFTDNGLPGELVSVKLLKSKSNYLEAETVAVLETVPERVSPRCDHYRVCSSYQYIDYTKQIEVKGLQVREIIKHVIGCDVVLDAEIPAPLEWGYRNKIVCRVVWDNGVPRAAYCLPGKHDEFIGFDECCLLSLKMNDLVQYTVEWIRVNGFLTVEEITVRECNYNGEMLLGFGLAQEIDRKVLLKNIGSITDRFPVVGVFSKLKSVPEAKFSLVYGVNEIIQKSADLLLGHGVESFYQVNCGQLDVLLNGLADELGLCGNESLVDLYCGVGTFGLALAKKVNKVVAVESDLENIRYLTNNVTRNDLNNVTVIHGKSRQWIYQVLAESPHVVIVDPPRVGLTNAVVKALVSSPPEKLMYLSCNPATFGRDLRMLLKVFRIQNLKMYDFFPQTPHIELCAQLVRL